MGGRRPPGVPAKPHYLPHNKITWSPPVVAFLKTITAPVAGAEVETLALQSWMMQIVVRRGVKPGKWISKFHHGRTASELANWLTENTRGHETVWLFSHDTKMDFTVTRLPLEMHRAGWTINDASLSGNAPWIRMGRGHRRICVVDSFSYLPHTPADLAERLGTPTPRRSPEETPAQWANRSARSDLDIVADAVTTLLDWWDKHALGKWSVSGASAGFHAMRHLPNPFKVVIDPDPERCAADRAAIYGGRRGAWVVGTRSLGPFLELDFTNAYPSVGAHLPLPSRRANAFESMALTNWRLTSDRWGIIAEVDLSTEVPRWPVRFSGGTFCPTGEFRTTLAGPEIRDALALDALVHVGPGHVHQLGWHLKPWAEWVIDVIHSSTEDEPVAARLAAKAWSRSVIGKFASRSYERIPLGHAPQQGWSYIEAFDHNTQTRAAIIDLAGERWWSGVSGDAEQAYPGVFAWVESEVRVRTSRVIEAVGANAVLQCDTDGLMVSERLLGTRESGGSLVAPKGFSGAARTKWVLDQLDPHIAPLTLRIKAKHKTVTVLGPQHVKTPAGRKFSGLPKLAVEVEPDVYRYKQWPGLAYQLAHGDPAGYVRPEVTVGISGPYAPGWIATDGRVIAPQCEIRPDGTNRLLAWHRTTIKPEGARLAQTQHPVLAALW